METMHDPKAKKLLSRVRILIRADSGARTGTSRR
jgi:hypothetical protein